ncbi:uncharacterized mitochondrial protein-like protein [Tanacetum coccineum]
MRDSWGSLLIKVSRGANRLYKAQIKVGKEEKYHSRSDGTPIPIARLETIRLLIALAAGKGWKIHHLDVKTAFLNDDTFMTGTSLDLINEFKKRMASQFEMSDLGELTYYLRNKVSQGKDCVEIKQERYARKILKEVDLTYSVSVVSRYMQSPRESHAGAIKQILRSLKVVDIDDGRSTTGHVFYLGTSPITWCSQKQTTVALSSCEAEFMAATAAACQAIWLRELLAEVTGLERQKVIIRVDNKSAIALSKNPVFHGRSKHIHTRYHFIRECVENEQVQGDEIITWCARVTLFDLEIQGAIVGEFLICGYGWKRGPRVIRKRYPMARVGPLSGKGPRVIVYADARILPRLSSLAIRCIGPGPIRVYYEPSPRAVSVTRLEFRDQISFCSCLVPHLLRRFGSLSLVTWVLRVPLSSA